ncbi:hypothetical protein GCM10008961_38230 [Deinococcus knuensis]|uniref:Uncharacterized protein n=1 Tax=Deinococcus knuensis TaxID=1837380 RepID=A0ABQ2SYV9_9DEIO|nr:hypothetical protein [Deinococcus knuensis]GGS43563.1 hypothetical protein GCM10008961_38230 [Deinococcus knuensis]
MLFFAPVAFLTARHPTGVQGGTAGGAQAAQVRLQGPAVPDGLQGRVQDGAARERGERDAVIRAEPGQESIGGGAGYLQRKASHAAAGVDDQGEVQGRRAKRGGGRHRDQEVRDRGRGRDGAGVTSKVMFMGRVSTRPTGFSERNRGDHGC